MKNIAIFLCDLTGVMAKPWVEAGYDCILVDLQHPEGITAEPDNPSLGVITRIGRVINHPDTWVKLREAMQINRVVFVAGFPPCTDVAVSGTKHFSGKAAKDPHFQTRAALIAEQCRTIGQISGAPWMFENPVSVFSSIFGKPQSVFNPYQFTGLCELDNYTKKTCLWTGGGFVMPKEKIHEQVASAIEMVRLVCGGKMPPKPKVRAMGLFVDDALDLFEWWYPDDRIHKAPPGPGRANFRSATPEGFAKAVFLANSPHLKPF